MKIRRLFMPFILCICVLGAGVIIAACSGAFAAQPPRTGQADAVETAVAATLMQYTIETKVAEGAKEIFGPPPTEPTATPPPPTEAPTPLPTPTPLEPSPAPVMPTPTPLSAGLPTILAEENTNCRRGPSTAYIVDAIFAKGSQAAVHGRDAGWDWWYIEMPGSPGQFCWVWDGSTVVQGDASALAVVEAPPQTSANTANLFTYSYSGYYDGYGYPPGYYPPYSGYYPYPFPCGVFLNGVKYPKCPPKKNLCYFGNCWVCNVYCYCECKPVFKNPCKKSGCPPVTIVNIDTYCDKYPKCCTD